MNIAGFVNSMLITFTFIESIFLVVKVWPTEKTTEINGLCGEFT
jgi:hypothetical protein